MKPDIQYRESIDLRADVETPGFTGHASHWWSADSYLTAFAPGAFKKSVKERGDRIPVLWQHNPNTPVGRHRSIKEDKTGLAVDVELIDDGSDGSVLIKRLRGGLPLGMSHGFQTIKDRSAEDDDPIDLSQLPKGVTKNDIRVLTEVRIWETSVVVFPANEAATIDAVREQQQHDLLSTLIESMRAGTLSDEQAAQIEQLAAAWQQRAGAGAGTPDPTPLPDETEARADREAYIRQLARSLGLTVEQMTCAV